MELTGMFALPLDLLLLFTALSPLAGILAARMRRNAISGVYSAAALAAAAVSIYPVYQGASAGAVSSIVNVGAFTSYMRVDMLAVAMSAVFLMLGVAAAVYSISYMSKERGSPLYYSLLLSMISGMVGVVYSGDLFTLFVFWEMMCISSYVLVAFSRGSGDSVEAAFKYLVMSGAGSATILLGISLLYGMSGTLSFEGLALAFGRSEPSLWIYVASIVSLVGFGVKAAVVPLHTWLPDAHSAAPSPISALLSGVVIEAGVYALCRLCFTAFLPVQSQWLPIVMVLSVVTMVVGNVMPLLQGDVKRLLAYSSIGHMGYILAGLSIGTQLALTGTFLHIFNHALMKGAAFLCVGAIIYRIGSRQIGDMSGIARRMPITATALAISLFALIGMPPLNGFISELTIVTAAFQSDLVWLGIAVILNSVLSASYYLRVIRVMLQPTASEAVQGAKEAPWLMLLPICALVGMIVIFGLWPDPVMDLMQRSAAGLITLLSQVTG